MHGKPNRQAPGGLPALTPRRLAVVLAAVLAVAAGAVAVHVATGSRPGCQQAFVPAYFYPGAGWTQAVTSKPPPSVMILDVTSSGAGSSPNRNYQAAVKRAQGAGITVMGYASTDYARRPAAAVEADVSHYRSWYHVTDVFLDQASSNGGAAAYYQRLTSYIHDVDPGSKVMLNPGTYPDQRYMSIGDIVLVYENTYAQYVKLRVPGWVRNYPAAKFARRLRHPGPGSGRRDQPGPAAERRLHLRDQQYRREPVPLTARLLAGRGCDHRQLRPHQHVVRRCPRPGRDRSGSIYWQGWRCPARADVNSVPSMPPEVSAGQKWPRSAAASLPQSSVYSASRTSFPARTYGGVTIPHVW